VNSSPALSLDLAPAASTHDEATVFTNADTAGGKPMTADDQTEIDFWAGMLEEHSNRAMLNISRESLMRLLGIIGKLRTEQRTQSSQEAPIHREWCMDCDGCGWCEGSPAYTCATCNGTGLQPVTEGRAP
jgi:hypothetical protein